MNPFERWDDWEWERAIQEVGKEQGRGRSGHPDHTTGRFRRPVKRGWGNFLNHWNGTQKRTLLAALLFLLIFFSANSADPFSRGIHSTYRSAMDSGNYYQVMTGMAKEALSLGGVGVKSTPVDAKMIGQFLPPISGPVMAAFGEVGKGGSNPEGSVHNGIDVGSALGNSVVAPADGVVTFVGEDPQLGKYVKVDFGDGWTTVLGNLGGIYVQQGQRVAKGYVVGTVGLSAPLKKPWLHFELRKNNQPVNPIPYLIPPESKN
ncbi:murein hydrolase activator EnvC [Desulfosporosinus sp. BICA1-9]|uniref:murein hydrolase activator EnvC family protein n=1 Tax=Desulfosporosinus sp. BICA1-9 TaxID=1531958 RepID=UPI00054B0C19|nr:M23 family metallopeptidase [Desulfosporosinus sp. BICA1-9]KJS50328.1 MAG: peptidase [Peptococcaceae bacterium BRH_c23]KJS88618.1 MAG: peptidase [Desulfosporosinus sp. BICA1-9]HBW35474.1 M23 family peptidase [Desulfosporosinus sp.]